MIDQSAFPVGGMVGNTKVSNKFATPEETRRYLLQSNDHVGGSPINSPNITPILKNCRLVLTMDRGGVFFDERSESDSGGTTR